MSIIIINKVQIIEVPSVIIITGALSGSPTTSLFWRTDVNAVWHRRTCLTNYDDQQTLKTDNDCVPPHQGWIEQGLTSPPTQYRLSGRQFHRSKYPTNSIKVLKEKLASHRPEEAPNPPGAFHRVTSEPLKKEKPYHSGSSPARQSPTQQAGLYKSCIEPYIVQQ